MRRSRNAERTRRARAAERHHHACLLVAATHSADRRPRGHYDEISRAKIVGLSIENQRNPSLLYGEGLVVEGMMVLGDPGIGSEAQYLSDRAWTLIYGRPGYRARAW